MHRKIEETPEREKMLIRLKELRLELDDTGGAEDFQSPGHLQPV